MTGLEPRYRVKKINDLAGKHDLCQFFVLDPQHDQYAVPAMLTYADACAEEYPDLAVDLQRVAGQQVKVTAVSDDLRKRAVEAAARARWNRTTGPVVDRPFDFLDDQTRQTAIRWMDEDDGYLIDAVLSEIIHR